MLIYEDNLRKKEGEMFKRSLLSSLLIIAVIIGASILVLPATGETTKTNRPERRTSEDPSQREIHESSSTPPFMLFFPIVSTAINPQLGLWKTIPFTDCPRISFTVSNTGYGFHLEDIGIWNESCQMVIDPNQEIQLLVYYDQWDISWYAYYKHYKRIQGEFTSPTLADGNYTLTYLPYPGPPFIMEEFPYTAEYIP
jgi:hypothetical protein